MPRPDPPEAGHLRIVPVDGEASFWNDRTAVVACLHETPPRIPAWFGYDPVGSALFEKITELPTYYLTRVEHRLLRRHATEMARLIDCTQVAELGSGSAKKTRLLLTACLQQRQTTYLPIDVSREMLHTSSTALQATLPNLGVTGLWGRYEAGLAWLRNNITEHIVVMFLGSNLGNTTPAERDLLLADIARSLRPGDGFLVSVDLQKPRDILEICYNDPPGRSAFADFRRNHLTHLNRRFGADFILDHFYPRAHYNPASAVVEGHLYATKKQLVSLPRLGLTLHLQPADSINVGFSKKFHRHRFSDTLTRHGFTLQAQWIDPVWQYGVFLFRLT